MDKAYHLIVEKLSRWLDELIKLMPNILLAAVVLALGLFIARYIKKLAVKLISKVSPSGALNNLVTSVIYFFTIGIVIFAVLSILQLDKAVTSILAGAGIIGLALAFAFQDIAANFISGIFITFRKPIKTGDIIKVKDYMGKVEEINLRDTVLRTFQGQMVIIPNKEVFQNPIENYSLLGKRRVDLTVGVSYGDDLVKVKEIAMNTVKNINGLSEEDKTTFFYTEFGDSSINFIIRLWVDSTHQPDYLEVASEAIMKLKAAFDENNISIPFPIRTLDFGIKGGETLKTMLDDTKET